MTTNDAPTGVATASNGQEYLQEAIAGLQATALNFAAMCINDANVRQQYMRDISATAAEISQAVKSEKLTAKEAADFANKMRNQILELSRGRSSPIARAYAMRLKKDGLSIGKLAERYAQRLFGKPFDVLAESQQATVYLEIVTAAGHGNPRVAAFASVLGKIGERLLLVSLAVAIYEIQEAEDKPREIARQGSLGVAGLAGGWVAGTGAVAVDACAATAPVCVGVAALIGGLLFASGADLTFGSIYPSPTLR